MSTSHDILLAKWLSHEISDEESLLLEESYDMDYLQALLSKQEDYTISVKPREEIWDNLAQKRINNTKSVHSSKANWLKYIFGLVILSLLGFLAYSLFFGNNLKEVETRFNANTPIAFADGSKVLIGPNSSLAYADGDWQTKRHIALEGQAFFEVNKGVPFIVETEAGKIEVLGTQFDVWSIDNKYMQVYCKEGRVRVSDNTGKSEEITQDQSILILDSNLQDVRAESKERKDWRENYRAYQTMPIEIVFRDLERFYKINFNLEQSISKDVFTGILPTNDLEKCIRFIETSLPYESKQSEHTILFSRNK